MLDLGDFLAHAQRDSAWPHLILECLGNFAVQKSEQFVPALDQRDLDAQSGHHARVFGADHAAADHDHRLGNMIQRKSPSEVKIVFSSNGTLAGRAGIVPVAMTTTSAADDFKIVRPIHIQNLGLIESGRAPDEFNVVAFQLIADQIQLVVHHLLADINEVGDGDVAFNSIAFAKQSALAHAGEIQHGFAQGFGGNGPRINGRCRPGRFFSMMATFFRAWQPG